MTAFIQEAQSTAIQPAPSTIRSRWRAFQPSRGAKPADHSNPSTTPLPNARQRPQRLGPRDRGPRRARARRKRLAGDTTLPQTFAPSCDASIVGPSATAARPACLTPADSVRSAIATDARGRDPPTPFAGAFGALNQGFIALEDVTFFSRGLARSRACSTAGSGRNGRADHRIREARTPQNRGVQC